MATQKKSARKSTRTTRRAPRATATVAAAPTAQTNYGPLAIILVIALVAVLFFAFGGAVGQSTQAPAVPAAETESTTAVSAQNTPGPNAQGPADSSYSVNGNTVMVSAGGKVVATVEFLTKVDNMPTEWLKDREGVVYLYQSGIGNKVELIVTLMENGAFAIDGDWMLYGGANLGVVNNAADFRAFADAPGEYHFTASSFGLAIGVYRASDDKAGFVLLDRRNADNDARPEFYLPSGGGKPVELGK